VVLFVESDDEYRKQAADLNSRYLGISLESGHVSDYGFFSLLWKLPQAGRENQDSGAQAGRESCSQKRKLVAHRHHILQFEANS
jgi:hypothetical protein